MSLFCHVARIQKARCYYVCWFRHFGRQCEAVTLHWVNLVLRRGFIIRAFCILKGLQKIPPESHLFKTKLGQDHCFSCLFLELCNGYPQVCCHKIRQIGITAHIRLAKFSGSCDIKTYQGLCFFQLQYFALYKVCSHSLQTIPIHAFTLSFNTMMCKYGYR